tara:strand:- start:1134 stop:2129 length:996 start_codon:yes stop_codon:yes gene_type:complete
MQKPARCANCEAQAASRYCPNCGQQQSGRLTLRQLGGDFAARFFSAERGLWKTFAELTARPGLTARNYLAGKRRTYVTPLFWYALCAAAQLFHIWLLGDAVPRLLTDNLPPEYFEFLSSQGIDSPKQWAGDRYVTLLQSSYTWLGLVTFVLPTAIVLRVIAGSRINLAESLVVSLLIIGHVMLITAVTGQVLMRVSPLWHGYVSYAIYFIYAVLTVGGCFRWNWRYVLAGSVAILVGGLCFFATLITLTVTVRTSWLGSLSCATWLIYTAWLGFTLWLPRVAMPGRRGRRRIRLHSRRCISRCASWRRRLARRCSNGLARIACSQLRLGNT